MSQSTSSQLEPQGPRVSVVIPAYNEEALLERSVVALVDRLSNTLEDEFEVLLCENGSTDRTLGIAHSLAQRFPQVQVEHLAEPSFGRAVRHGILNARGRDVAIFNVDFWNVAFLSRAVGYLTYYDVVVGSKATRGAHDRRPFHRRLVTRLFNLLLRLLFGFQGSDAHGITAFNRARVQPILEQCQTDGEIMTTELMIRAQRAGLRYRELPVAVREQRPTRRSLFFRLPSVVSDLWTLGQALRRPTTPVEEVFEEERM